MSMCIPSKKIRNGALIPIRQNGPSLNEKKKGWMVRYNISLCFSQAVPVYMVSRDYETGA